MPGADYPKCVVINWPFSDFSTINLSNLTSRIFCLEFEKIVANSTPTLSLLASQFSKY
jgi:hypothetical protein